MRGLLRNTHLFVGLILFCSLCIVAYAVYAHEGHEHLNVPPPKAHFSKDSKCVEPIEVMRKKHFEFILDHRDRTVIEGIRTTKYSLNECIECHITPDKHGEYARYQDEHHFCADCHYFAAVNIDCFQCHADRPEQAVRASIKNKSENTKQ